MTDQHEQVMPRGRRCAPAAVVALVVIVGGIGGSLSASSTRAQSPPWQTTVVSLSPSAPLAPPTVERTPAPMPRDAVAAPPPPPYAAAAPAPAVPVVLAPGSGLKFKPGSVPRFPTRLPPPRAAPDAVPPYVTGAIAPTAAAGATAAVPAAAAAGAPAAPPKADPVPAPTPAPIVIRRPATAGREDGDLVEQYCAQVGDIAGRTRTELERRSIVDMTEQLDKRISLLEQKTAEHKSWLAKREQFLANAQESLVRIYTRMKSEAAASQLAAMDETSAAAIVAKMEPKMASSILSDMDPVKAARLTSIIAGAAEIVPPTTIPERSGTVR